MNSVFDQGANKRLGAPTRNLQCLTLFMLLLTCSAVQAQLADPLGIWPDNPAAGEPIALLVPNSLCLAGFENPQGLTQNQTMIDDLIILEIVALPAPCVPLPLTYGSLPFEPLDEGNYRLEFYYVEPDVTFPSTPAERIFLGELQFGVGPAPIGVPVNSIVGLVGLMLLMILLGLGRLRPGVGADR
jgi:hypothetical protein